MPAWKSHNLATDPRPEVDLKVNQKVVSIVDLPGIPAGSTGKVVLANGFNWIRYSVRFENGTRATMLDARHIKAA